MYLLIKLRHPSCIHEYLTLVYFGYPVLADLSLFWLSRSCPFGFLALKEIIWLSYLPHLSVHDEDYSRKRFVQ